MAIAGKHYPRLPDALLTSFMLGGVAALMPFAGKEVRGVFRCPGCDGKCAIEAPLPNPSRSTTCQTCEGTGCIALFARNAEVFAEAMTDRTIGAPRKS